MTDVTSERGRETRDRQIRHGISWNAANLVVNKGIAILVRLLLARLLVPEDFGLIAMIVVFLGLVNIFVDFGLKNALIQRRRDANSRIRYDSAFWFLLGGGILWMLLYMLAGIPMMIWFYDEPQLSNLAMVMGISILLHSLATLPEVRLARRMRFKSLVIAELASTVFASAIAIGLALGGAGVWALAAQQLLAVGIRAGMIWQFARWRPRWRFLLQSLRDLVRFSGWTVGNQAIFFFRNNLDKILIGSLLGAAALGLYALAFAIVEAVRTSLSKILTNVMFPVFSRINNDNAQVKELYVVSVSMMALIVMPSTLLIVMYAEILVQVIGAQWSEAVEIMQVLSFTLLIYGLSGAVPEALQAMGRVKSIFVVTFFCAFFVLLPLLIISVMFFGLREIAISVVINALVVRILMQRRLLRSISLTRCEIYSAIKVEIFVFGGFLAAWSQMKSAVATSIWAPLVVLAFSLLFIRRRKRLFIVRKP